MIRLEEFFLWHLFSLSENRIYHEIVESKQLKMLNEKFVSVKIKFLNIITVRLRRMFFYYIICYDDDSVNISLERKKCLQAFKFFFSFD